MGKAEIARRKFIGRNYSGNSPLSSKLVCADCGGYFGQKVWHSTSAYRRVIWRCNAKFEGETKCSTPTLDVDTIQQMFLKAYNQLMGDREQVIEDCKAMQSMLTDSDALDNEICRVNEEIEVVAGLVKACVLEHATKVQEQEAFDAKYNRLGIVVLVHLELLATLHEIGKVGIAENIMNKQGKLDEKEWIEMKRHPETGYRIAMSSFNLAPIPEYILHHHERWDGRGYPQNLKGLTYLCGQGYYQ